ncbi:MoaD/ThiS family protein [Serinibacter salmoneus]|uniref:Molybdopterin converting factor small subunit n=1 Tax=Serinibacter salmoneus TaxID=556530 RepID=A0A2A9D2U6_9MICO|nr:MoaD/ThiS family protein [Serinibacter salmoneus]PFG21027.1 molybdopterin converting factor small subunit [Serinibacter salmoneus]
MTTATTVRLFAGAAEAVGAHEVATSAGSVGELMAELAERGGPLAVDVLGRCSVLVAGQRADGPHAPIPAGAVVDVLPPFAGG